MTEQSKRPERIARPPVRLVTVKDAGGIGRDAAAATKLGELFGFYVIADYRIL